MLYPAQTSLIPVQIALTRFLEQSGLSALFSDYPYWYLGTTPFKYLTGPILPSFLALIHRFLPSLSLFEIMLGVVGASWVLGSLGVWGLVRELGGERRVASFSAFFYLFGPIAPFLFRFSDGLYLIAFSFLPFVLLKYLKYLKLPKRREAILLVILISFLLLLDTSILLSLVLGMAAIFLAQVGWEKAEEKLKKSLLLITYCLLLVTPWYTLGYWLALLGAPSFGGKGLAGVVVWLGKLLPIALAFVFAVVSVKFFKKRDILRDFCFYWLFVFGFLTLIRFLSDPDFWLDWSSYGTELQFGLAIIGGIAVVNLLKKVEYQRSNIKYQEYIVKIKYFLFLICIFSFYFLIFAIVFGKYVLGTFQHDITQSVEYRIGSQLSQVAKHGERVFLSGTTVFWLNAFFDVPQVRGGRDQVSVDPSWRRVVWEIREGTTTEGTGKALRSLNVSYLVVHTEESEEFYHDFKYPGKFEEVPGLTKIFDEKGDRIYKVED